jgi:hypothetical protein
MKTDTSAGQLLVEALRDPAHKSELTEALMQLLAEPIAGLIAEALALRQREPSIGDQDLDLYLACYAQRYAHPINRAKTAAAWREAATSVERRQTIMRHLDLWLDAWTDPKYIPAPHTFLADGLWQSPPPSQALAKRTTAAESERDQRRGDAAFHARQLSRFYELPLAEQRALEAQVRAKYPAPPLASRAKNPDPSASKAWLLARCLELFADSERVKNGQ